MVGKKSRVLTYCDLGLIDYKEAWELQRKTSEFVYHEEISDVFYMLEHPNTYTLGRTADKKHLISSKEYLDKNKISVYDIDRGGDITYHGPGQIVGYPIIKLEEWQKDTHKYLRALEEVIIRTCAEYKLTGIRDSKYTGVWIENRKIAAIGIKISRWITMHGFAFNVDTDLSLFNGIIPCGIADKEVTSIDGELNKQIEIPEVKAKLLKHFREVFNYDEILNLQKEEILSLQLTKS